MQIMRLIVLVVSLAPLAQAQVPFPSPTGLPSSDGSDDMVLAMGGLAAGTLSALGFGGLVAGPEDAFVPWILVSEAGYILGAGLGVHLAGLAADIEGDLSRGMTGAFIGGGLGMGATGGLLLASGGGTWPEAIGAVVVGGGLVVLLSTAMAANGYRVIPAPLALHHDGGGVGIGLAIHATF